MNRLRTFLAWYRLLRRLRPHASAVRPAWKNSGPTYG
jgi:hypothetical protein